jgi:nucleoside recognition membrane protein YjiH
MKSRHALTVFLAVVLVPIALGFAGASVMAAILSISVFWACLGIFFYPSISDYFKAERRQRDD